MTRSTRSSARLRGTSSSTADDVLVTDSSSTASTSTAGGGGGEATAGSSSNNNSNNVTVPVQKPLRRKRKAGTTPNASSSKASKQAKRIPGRPPSLSASPPPKPPKLLDRLTPLSTELISLILSHLTLPPLEDATGPTAHLPRTDLNSLASLCLVNKGLLPHARAALYRQLKVETRVQAHAVHRTLHGNDVNKVVRNLTADVGSMSKTSSQWLGWFLFHSMHSLCGIIGSCRHLLSLTLFLPADSAAWTQSLCNSFTDLKNLQILTKDVEPSSTEPHCGGAGRHEGMDVGWRPKKEMSMWAVSQFVKPLGTLRNLHTLRLCGISSDSSTLPSPPIHSLRLTEVVLIEVNITNTDLLQILGDAKNLKKFTLWRSSLLSKRGLTHVLKKCPNLVELKVGGSWFGAAKAEDDTNFPMDLSLPHLPHLKLLHCSGPLISPAALLLPSISLSHLLVHGAPSFTPQSVHSALVKMRHDPPSVERLTLPEMKEDERATRRSNRANQANGNPPAEGTVWNDAWRFTVKKTAEAKGVLLEDKWRKEVTVPGAGGAAGAEDDGDSSDSD
ncbi:hypothetical protein JCM3765_001047 [Sporobolomyces pararoseus]